MEQLVSTILPYISPSALPVVLVVLGGLYIYRKIDGQRKVTAVERDKEFSDIHDTILKHEFEISNLKGTSLHHAEVLDDLRDTVGVLNANIVKLTVTVESLCESIKDSNKRNPA